MKKLPSDFTYHKYGIDVRLANVDDSEFILSLRTNPDLNAYIHVTDANIEKQRIWMKEYKDREKAGLDYYFVFSMAGIPFGLERVYNIDQDTDSYTGGSWICVPGVTPDQILRQALASLDIVNNYLCLNENHYDVRKGNKKVLHYHRHFIKAREEGETSEDILFYTDAAMRKEIIARLEKFL